MPGHTAPDRWVETVFQVAKDNPGLTEGSIRGYIQNREVNGLEEADAVTWVGRRVFLVQPAFNDWLMGKPKPNEARRRIEAHQEKIRQRRADAV